MVLEMLFLSFSNANVKFAELKRLTWRTYIIAEALPTTNQDKLIDKKEFAKTALDQKFETFIVHVAALKVSTAIPFHLSRTSQIQRLDEPILAAL